MSAPGDPGQGSLRAGVPGEAPGDEGARYRTGRGALMGSVEGRSATNRCGTAARL
jgi:hypothetical protein